jgi:hypothetical protein
LLQRRLIMAAKRIGGAILALVVPPLLLGCGGSKPASKPSGKAPAACKLDLKDPDAIMKAELGFEERKLEERVKSALAAGARLEPLATKVEDEVSAACRRLAQDLGANEKDVLPKQEGPGKAAEAACATAAKTLTKVKRKLGPDASVDVKVEPPFCEVPLDDVVECSADCDGDIKQEELKADCEGGKVTGKCKGKCEGACTVKSDPKCAGSCSGSCEGKCDSDINGRCEGKCQGKCDGKESKGNCEGVCEGKCTGKVKASCSGKCEGACSGECETTGRAECPGKCATGCSVALAEPKCSGNVRVPDTTNECKASCRAKLNAELSCRPATVVVKVTNAKSADNASKLTRALEASLPALAKVNLRMDAELVEVTASVHSALEDMRKALSEGGAAARKVESCLAAALKTEADSTTSIKKSLKGSAAVGAAAGTN